MTKLSTVSRLFRYLFTLYLLFIPLSIIFVWLIAPNWVSASASLVNNYFTHNGFDMVEIDFGTRLVAFFINLFQGSITMFMMGVMIKLFKCYEEGEIFSERTVSLISWVGYSLMASTLVATICDGLTTYVITAAIKKPTFILTLTESDFKTILIAFIIILVSWIASEGYKMQTEQSLTI